MPPTKQATPAQITKVVDLLDETETSLYDAMARTFEETWPDETILALLPYEAMQDLLTTLREIRKAQR